MSAANAGSPQTVAQARKRAWVVGIIGAAAMFADGYDISALGLAIPLLAADFGMSPAAFAPAASSSLAGMALGAMFISPLGARYGLEKMLTLMMLVIGFSTFGTMFSSRPIELSFWRFICGLGLGASAPFVVSLTSITAPAKRRMFVVTLVVSAVGGGALAAGFLAPVLADWFGWQGIFALGAIMPTIVGLISWLFLVRGNQPKPVALKTKSPGEAPQYSVFKRALLPFMSVGELLHQSYLRLTLLMCAIWMANMYMNYSVISWLPTLLVGAGWDLAVAARSTGLLAVGGIVGGLIISALVDRSHKPRLVLLVSYLLGLAVLMMFSLFPHQQTLWVGLLLVLGLTIFGTQIALNSITANFYPVAMRSTAIGWCSGFGRIGSVMGPLVLGLLIGAEHKPESILGSLALPALICGCCVILLPVTPRPVQVPVSA